MYCDRVSATFSLSPRTSHGCSRGRTGSDCSRRSWAPFVEGDVTGEWDVDRLQQIASNLVGNAMQHGENTTPIAVRVEGLSPDHVVLSVANAGVIPPDILPSIFDPFHCRRLEGGEGLGLGLYIVQQIAQGHHGTIGAALQPYDAPSATPRLGRQILDNPPSVDGLPRLPDHRHLSTLARQPHPGLRSREYCVLVDPIASRACTKLRQQLSHHLAGTVKTLTCAVNCGRRAAGSNRCAPPIQNRRRDAGDSTRA